MILERRGFIDGVKNTKIFYRYWEPKNPRGAVILLHGLGLNSGFYYKDMGEFLADNNYIVYALDYRGHGFSQGIRGHVEKFEDLLKDIDVLIQIVNKKGFDTYLVGENLGGLLAVGCAVFNPDKVKGIVSMVPALAPKAKIPKLKLLVGRSLSKVAPTMNILDSFGPEQFIKKCQNIDEETKKSFVLNFTLNFAVEMVEGTKKIKERLPILDVPAIFLLSDNDEIMDTRAIKDMVSQTGKNEIKCYEDLSHFLLLDDYSKVSGEILEWLNSHTPISE